MNEREAQIQQELHEVIERAVHDPDAGDAEDELILSGWVIVYETTSLTAEGKPMAGHIYGPQEMTTWRALGLVEWARRFALVPDEEG